MRLCSAKEMAAVDQHAINELGVPGAVLMENAGRACCDQFEQAFGSLFPGPVLVMAGKGNNGGDGYVMARVLADRGWRVETLVLGSEAAISGDARIMLDILNALALPVDFIADSEQLRGDFARTDWPIIVDAVFGTGLNSAVRGLQREAIRLINASAAAVFAVDIPSGVDGSSGRVLGLAVDAELTVTFDHAKIGHGSRPGADCVGQLKVVDIGIPRQLRPQLSSRVRLLDEADARALLPTRATDGHKGSFGHLLVVAGSPGKTGAAALAGNCAARSGCGLVTVATPAAVHDIIEVKLTEAMSCPLADQDGLLSFAARPQLEALLSGRQAVAVGPGLGQSAELARLLGWLIGHVRVPLVIDADGLNLLAGQLELLQQPDRAPLVLTPHPGEMSRLCGLSVAEIEANRFECAAAFAAQYNVVLLLKGARTVIAAADGRVDINTTGNDGLAAGGSGDVLTGLIGGLLAQGMDAFAAASLGAWLHGRAAELIAETSGTAGMIATDLISHLPVARHELLKGA